MTDSRKSQIQRTQQGRVLSRQRRSPMPATWARAFEVPGAVQNFRSSPRVAQGSDYFCVSFVEVPESVETPESFAEGLPVFADIVELADPEPLAPGCVAAFPHAASSPLRIARNALMPLMFGSNSRIPVNSFRGMSLRISASQNPRRDATLIAN